MNISNRMAGVAVIILIGLVVANDVFSPVASVPDKAKSNTPSGPLERHAIDLLDEYTANVSLETPKPFTPNDPVRARAVPVLAMTAPIPGAIVCADHDTVALMMDLFKAHLKEQIENQILGDRMNLIRGNPSPEPDLDASGCVLVQAGTILDRLKTFGRAVQVEGFDATGKRIHGVTDFLMIEELPRTRIETSNLSGATAESNPDGSTPSEVNAEIPELSNTPELVCSSNHQGCTDAEFSRVIADIRKQWSEIPPWMRQACRSNSTASGMEDCFLDQTLNWQNAHPNDKPSWQLVP
jgi:hypothetical protein